MDGAIRVTVSGKVQGVGYRWSCAEEARRLELRGWVMNLADGRVQAHFEGAENDLEAMAHWCGEGPRGADVADMEVESATLEGFTSFEIRR